MKEAILLAGGLGTRLQTEVKELPKSMAPINGKPFLAYQIDYLKSFGIDRVIIATGYLSEFITDYFKDSYNEVKIEYSHESEPLGTGGAISQALDKTSQETVLILNGDTMFQVDLNTFYQSHTNTKADFSLALKPLENIERYGVVNIDNQNQVTGFEEKQFQAKGNINGGVYLVNKSKLKKINFEKKFSFEKEFLEKEFENLHFNGFISNTYFLDIGIPKDYQQAQIDFKKQFGLKTDNTWTLFLDRDGVINKKRDNDYVKSINEFEFIDGAKEAISNFSKLFDKIVVVTNQQCVGKNIITKEKLDEIHEYMSSEINKVGGRIDKVYYAPQLKSENSIYRKPNTGMADLAKNDFSSIDFSKSVMIGDSLSDIKFGNDKNMTTILISDNFNSAANYRFSSLFEIYLNLFA